MSNGRVWCTIGEKRYVYDRYGKEGLAGEGLFSIGFLDVCGTMSMYCVLYIYDVARLVGDFRMRVLVASYQKES